MPGAHITCLDPMSSARTQTHSARRIIFKTGPFGRSDRGNIYTKRCRAIIHHPLALGKRGDILIGTIGNRKAIGGNCNEGTRAEN